MINLARDLEAVSIAEGVEEKEQLALLKEIGCDCIQGFTFAKPMSLSALIEFLKDQN